MIDRRRLMTGLAGLPLVAALAALGGRAQAGDEEAAPASAEGGAHKAGPPRIAVVYSSSVAGKLDKSFNQSASEGVEAARGVLEATIREYLPTEPQEEPEMIERAAGEADLVITIGYGLHGFALASAPRHPAARFTVIDAEVDRPAFQSVTFREQEGAFLAGLLAAGVSRTGRLGFLGGMPTPGIERFRKGYTAGARHGGAGGTIVLEKMIGTTQAGFQNPFAGMLEAEALIAAGADVIFAAAGRSGLGAYQAACDSGVLAIGVDSNQNYLFPGTMLTSVIKRVDTAVLQAAASFASGQWLPGPLSLGLREEGMGLALDHHNRPLIPTDLWQRVDAAREAIVTGRLVVET
ncbi:BMP family lipoprotein [Rhodospirillum rubrum]|uniref:Twin-arginine translocation pathway signal n=1 Tax=Rhodospirillum rubrum (strain ATCC 11170 / ATH 1.1.1 / DSM 467 / LMG 4362 / NCIMB 8255 / S1) TaxID=269796 RepID=Q2RVQ5_RHORT|nr:BMP family ABC transporter substrate-binding protein [Rhodospirillum rubrum]ABC21790.1 Twin-arginine translocation pathway signal [Rhodospirillum rubrum ATCC 11170]AEO47490.1 twin-arginine translocation pathway signal [Rhodospirillum rubrum F11]QXG81454.1 BMP family ABC transporter substrate-binding protein [Rhodospirillum rubrum]HCF17260.1 BMP family ABC transporter substrate-binding protein [Rhodospirillum rubrum]